MIKLKARIFAYCVLMLLAFSMVTPASLFGCTIVSAVGADGQVWNSNNEDGPIGVANFINVFPKWKETKYGYFTFSYFLPKLGEGSSIQGGLNEVLVEAHEEGIKISYEDGYSMLLQPQSENVFFMSKEDIRIEFGPSKKTNQLTMSLYENGFWVYNALKSEAK